MKLKNYNQDIKPINIIFMGTPEFSTLPLEYLSIDKNINVNLVITGKDKIRSRNKLLPTKVKQKALDLGLEVYETDNINSKESINKIDEINPDYIVVIAFGEIIKDELLEKYKDKFINVHSSLLPKYRGAAPMQWTILNKEKKAGVSTMLIDSKMDTGDILDKKEISIDSNTNINTLHDKLSVLASELIVDTVLNFDNRYDSREVQDDKKASYSKKINKEMGHLDFEDKAEDIKAKIMAFGTWPSTYVYYKDEKIKIHNINIIEKYTNNEPGEIFKVSKEGIFVNSIDKCIVITEIQVPGKKKMTVESFLNGNDIETSEYLR